MYKAKSKGKAQYALFDASLHPHVSAQLQARRPSCAGRSARGRSTSHYQPICSLRDQRLHRASRRWCAGTTPSAALLEPATFIPAAEETGLIVPLGNWVLDEACRQMQRGRPRTAATCA